MNHYTYESYLEHSGKKGMRWGAWKSRSAKYEHGVMAGSGKRGGSSKKKRTLLDKAKSAHYNRKRIQRINDYNKRREAEANEQAKKKMTREQLVESGNARLVRANKDKLSTQDLKNAIDRIETERRLDKITKDDAYNRGVTAADRVINAMDKADKAIRVGSSLYNDISTIYNHRYASDIKNGTKKPMRMAPEFKTGKKAGGKDKVSGKGKSTNININL